MTCAHTSYLPPHTLSASLAKEESVMHPSIYPQNQSNHHLFFLPSSFTRLLLLILLSSQTLHPLSAKSSSTTKSLHRPIRPTQLSTPHSTHPFRRAHSVIPNHETAHSEPASVPTVTWKGVW